ncbi:hypothetical protein HY570_04075 [Candidatus Micrarchaeota archaeon]|nr:hypothetical protein [Candidatus Micrarchaeota archaeon]
MTFGRYGKGARGERELINFFFSKGFSVIRAAGSGVNSLSPDLLVFKKEKKYAFECKAWDKSRVEIEREKFVALQQWQENTEMRTFVGWRLNRKGWYFIPLEEMKEGNKTYSMTFKNAELVAKRLEDLL